MDYRLVKQFSNSAVDSFFNFFYKIWDFLKVLIDLFWAFVDIWYQFSMIFVNIWLYGYYLFLFVLDTLSMSGLLSKKASARTIIPGSKAFRPDIVVPINPMFGKINIPKPAIPIPLPKPTAPVSAKSKDGAMKRNVPREAAEGLVAAFRGFGRSIYCFFKGIADMLGSKLKPVREEDDQKKSLIDEYMREYERKKRV
jgi:hypothetical protein